MKRPSQTFGFTLLEVMVAIAILAVGLTAIFSSQGQAMRAASRAKFINVATQLARCKMGEIEEEAAERGLPAVDAHDTDECCEGAEVEGFECEWRLSRIVLPDVALEEGAEGEGGDPSGVLSGALGDTGSQIGAVDSMLAGGSTDAFAEMAMSYAFPVLKPSIEEQVRRAEVIVKWHEGSHERSFNVVQFLVAEQPPAAPAPAPAPTPGEP